MAIEKSINKALKQVDFKSRNSGNGSGSGKGSFAKSDGKFHKCGKKGCIQKDCKSEGNGSGGNTPKKSMNELPEWVTTNPVDSDNQDLTTDTMNHNDKKYKWCTSCNNGRVHGDFTGRMAMRSGKISKARSHLVVFPIPPPIKSYIVLT